MYVSSVSALAAGSETGSETSSTKSATSNPLDNTQFMQMLLAQLKNQNPMEPVDDQQMLGQMAQLNSLQALQAIQSMMDGLASANQTTYAATLIGKTVSASFENGEVVQGVVSSAILKSGTIYLQVGDHEVPINAISQISQEATA